MRDASSEHAQQCARLTFINPSWGPLPGIRRANGLPCLGARPRAHTAMQLAAPATVYVPALAGRACPCGSSARHTDAFGWKRNQWRGRILVSALCPSGMAQFVCLKVLPPEQSPGCLTHHGQHHPNFPAPLKLVFTSRTGLHPHHTTTALSYREVRVVRTGISTGHPPHFPHLPHHTFEGADGCQSR